MATEVDIVEDNFKSSRCNILSEEELVDLELDWIGKLREQVEFSNKALTRFNLNLKVARKWRSWNKINIEQIGIEMTTTTTTAAVVLQVVG